MSTDLVEPLAPGLEALLEAARSIPAPPADLQRRLLARLEVALGLPGGPGASGSGTPSPMAPAEPGPAPATPASGGPGAAAHLLPHVLAHPWTIGAALVVVGLGAGALWYGVRARPPRAVPGPATIAAGASPVAAPAAAAPAVSPVAAPPVAPSTARGAVVATPSSARRAVVPDLESSRRSWRRGAAPAVRVGGSRVLAVTPMASRASEHAGASTERPAADEAARDTTRPPATPAAAPPEVARSRPPDQPELDDEMAPIEAARTALGRGDAALALRQLAAHERQFPHGRLIEEREALRIRALATAGRDRELRARAAAFLARFPHSLFRPMVEQALGVAKR